MVPKGTIISAQSKKEQTRSDDGSISRRLALLRQSRSLTLPRQSLSLALPRQSRSLALLCQSRSLTLLCHSRDLTLPRQSRDLALPRQSRGLRPTLSFPQFLAGIHGKAQKPGSYRAPYGGGKDPGFPFTRK